MNKLGNIPPKICFVLFICAISIYLSVMTFLTNKETRKILEQTRELQKQTEEFQKLKQKHEQIATETCDIRKAEENKYSSIKFKPQAEELPGWQKVEVRLDFLWEGTPYYRDVYYKKGPMFSQKGNFYDLFIRDSKGSLTFDGNLITHAYGEYRTACRICFEVVNEKEETLVDTEIQGNKQNLFRAIESICEKEGLVKQPFDCDK